MKQELIFSVYSLKAYKYERSGKGTIIWYNLGVKIGGNIDKIFASYCIGPKLLRSQWSRAS